jgi:hypothetical protein
MNGTASNTGQFSAFDAMNKEEQEEEKGREGGTGGGLVARKWEMMAKVNRTAAVNIFQSPFQC